MTNEEWAAIKAENAAVKTSAELKLLCPVCNGSRKGRHTDEEWIMYHPCRGKGFHTEYAKQKGEPK